MSYITKAHVNVPVINTNSSNSSNSNNNIDGSQHQAVNEHQTIVDMRYGVYDMMMLFSVVHSF